MCQVDNILSVEPYDRIVYKVMVTKRQVYKDNFSNFLNYKGNWTPYVYNEFGFFPPFMTNEMRYEIGAIYSASMYVDIDDGVSPALLGMGYFHSYIYLEDAINFILHATPTPQDYVVAKCTIPKGTLSYLGVTELSQYEDEEPIKYPTIASKKIIMNEIVFGTGNDTKE